MTSSRDMWDERYSRDGFLYGTSPNEFLAAVASKIPPGRVLCLGDGEGRNSVYLAELGYEIVAVDQSAIGMAKAQELATARNVRIETVVSDLADYPIAPESWDGIVSIFCHLPPELRRRVHADVVSGLKPGGVFVLEAYTPEQLEFGTGGPPTAELMMTLADLRGDLEGLEIEQARELHRDVTEGSHHCGLAAVVQVLAVKASL